MAYNPYAQDPLYRQYQKSKTSATSNVAQMPKAATGTTSTPKAASPSLPAITANTYKGQTGSWNQWGDFVPSTTQKAGTAPTTNTGIKYTDPDMLASMNEKAIEGVNTFNGYANAAGDAQYEKFGTGIGYSTEDVNNSYTNQYPGVGQYVGNLYNLATNPSTIQAPVAPNTQVAYQMQPYMSMDEALKRANEQLNPTEELNRMNMLNTYRQQREKLPQYLNARGQAFGGLRGGLETELTQDEAMALEELSLRSAAEKQNVAQSLYQGDFDRAQSLSDRLFQQEQLNAQLANQQWQAQMQSFNQDKSQRTNSALALAELMQRQQEAQRAAENDLYQFNNLNAWQQAQLTQGNVNSDLERQLLEARIAETQRAANAPYSSGGGTSGGLTEYQKWQIQQTEKENAATAPNYTFEYLSAVPTYTSREQALGELKKYETIMKQRGVDPNVIRTEIDRLFPAKNTPSFNMPSNEALRSLVPGMPRY